MPTNVRDQWGNAIDPKSMKPVMWNGKQVGWMFTNPLTGQTNYAQSNQSTTGTGKDGRLQFVRPDASTMVSKSTQYGPIQQSLQIDGVHAPVFQNDPNADPSTKIFTQKKEGQGFDNEGLQTFAALATLAAGGALAGGAIAGSGAGAGAAGGAGGAGAIGATGSGGAGGIAMSPAAAASFGGGGAGVAGGAGGAGAGLGGALTWGDVATMGGTALSAGSSLMAADKQSDAANNAANMSMQQFGQTRADLAPWVSAGRGALSDLMNPSLDKFHADPGYQFNLEQGMDAINKASASRHDYYAPQTLQDVGKFAQGMASNEYSNYWNRLFAMSGTGQNAAAQTGAFGANATNMAGNSLMGGANAQAAGIVGASNAISGGIGDVYNAWLTRQILGQQSLYG